MLSAAKTNKHTEIMPRNPLFDIKIKEAPRVIRQLEIANAVSPLSSEQ
ncbi:hypothetical protein VPMS16_174 [Vibrio sp. 16]|nr:hypothetical protein VPMS16_174 [Vibrio sp. 16]